VCITRADTDTMGNDGVSLQGRILPNSFRGSTFLQTPWFWTSGL
jgi:hypothetical protein